MLVATAWIIYIAVHRMMGDSAHHVLIMLSLLPLHQALPQHQDVKTTHIHSVRLPFTRIFHRMLDPDARLSSESRQKATFSSTRSLQQNRTSAPRLAAVDALDS